MQLSPAKPSLLLVDDAPENLSVLAGVLGDRLDRPRIVAFAAVLWGVMTIALGLMTSVNQAMAYAAVNGVGLSLLIPSVQSVIADYYDASSRGRAPWR